MKQRGESVHAGLRTFTSTALRPIRYLGEKASTIAKVSGEEKEKDRPIMDTVGGLGNGKLLIIITIIIIIIIIMRSYGECLQGFHRSYL